MTISSEIWSLARLNHDDEARALSWFIRAEEPDALLHLSDPDYNGVWSLPCRGVCHARHCPYLLNALRNASLACAIAARAAGVWVSAFSMTKSCIVPR